MRRLTILACVATLTDVATLLCVVALAPASARAGQTQESIFQDDNHLVFSPTATVEHTLAILRSLGVQRVRVNVEWAVIAPSATSALRPAGFDAADPADYPAAGWVLYDRVLKLAERDGIGVEFNITSPGPLWAMRQHPPTARAANHWVPNPEELYRFAYALGRRYSGAYEQIPRVHVWSIWNEHNQPGWLAPQWGTAAGGPVADSPRLYRACVQAVYAALVRSGHAAGRDTILIGELASEGSSASGFYTAMKPMPFLRALYCVDGEYRPVRGASAAALGCPTGRRRAQFVRANPGLFDATGFAHHPYSFLLAPAVGSPDPDFVPLADLGRLERGLDRALHAYGINRRMPIYVTEYGYQTNPPSLYQIVTPATQAGYLNQADYIAWRDPRVRSVAQFLLYDSGPDFRFRPADFYYWDRFQSGLLFADGRRKPAYAAYRMPIWIPAPHVSRGGRMLVWGQLRPAPHVREHAEIQWRGSRGGFRTVATVTTTNRRGYLTARVRPAGSGEIRIAWRAPGGRVLASRRVPVRVR